MTQWQDFFDQFRRNGTAPAPAPIPGPILFNFVNRYLEPMPDIKYKIVYEGREEKGTTTAQKNSVKIETKTLAPVKVYAWSRRASAYKLIDTCTPKMGVRQLINERMKTFKHDSRTHPHPAPQVLPPPSPPPRAPAPRPPAPGPTPTANQGVQPQQRNNSNGEPEHQTQRPVPGNITVAQLKKIFPAAPDDYLGNVAAELNADLPKYKLDTILRRSHFFAQVRQEAGPTLSPKQENLNYRPAVLRSKFSYYGSHPDEATADGRLEEMRIVQKTVRGVTRNVQVKTVVHRANQETIANKAYGDRSENGTASTGDGWRFRGRGIFQLTLRKNYRLFNEEYHSYWGGNQPNFLVEADQVVEFPYYIRSAVWYWLKNSVYLKADAGSTATAIDNVTEAINGRARDGAAERRHNFDELTYPAFR